LRFDCCDESFSKLRRLAETGPARSSLSLGCHHSEGKYCGAEFSVFDIDGYSADETWMVQYRNNGGERVVQSMQKENGTQKGVQMILKERGKHTNAAGVHVLWPTLLDSLASSMKESLTTRFKRQCIHWNVPVHLESRAEHTAHSIAGPVAIQQRLDCPDQRPTLRLKCGTSTSMDITMTDYGTKSSRP
jgi:hypothetical protein